MVLAIDIVSKQLKVPTSDGDLNAVLQQPLRALGLVLLVHGPGGNRQMFRSRKVGRALAKRGLSTLQINLLLNAERHTNEIPWDLNVLTDRLVSTLQWIDRNRELSALPLGLLGTGSGAAVVIEAAVREPGRVAAIVSCAGRPDLAFESLATLECPILLLVGKLDVDLLELNAWATSFLRAKHELAVLQEMSDLLAEPKATELVADLTAEWMLQEM